MARVTERALVDIPRTSAARDLLNLVGRRPLPCAAGPGEPPNLPRRPDRANRRGKPWGTAQYLVACQIAYHNLLGLSSDLVKNICQLVRVRVGWLVAFALLSQNTA